MDYEEVIQYSSSYLMLLVSNSMQKTAEGAHPPEGILA
jgi:hypothetical protein